MCSGLCCASIELVFLWESGMRSGEELFFFFLNLEQSKVLFKLSGGRWCKILDANRPQRQATKKSPTNPCRHPIYPISTRLRRKWDIWKLAVDVEPFFLPHKSERGLMTAKTWWGYFETECVVLMLFKMALYLALCTLTSSELKWLAGEPLR